MSERERFAAAEAARGGGGRGAAPAPLRPAGWAAAAPAAAVPPCSWRAQRRRPPPHDPRPQPGPYGARTSPLLLCSQQPSAGWLWQCILPGRLAGPRGTHGLQAPASAPLPEALGPLVGGRAGPPVDPGAADSRRPAHTPTQIDRPPCRGPLRHPAHSYTTTPPALVCVQMECASSAVRGYCGMGMPAAVLKGALRHAQPSPHPQ